MPVDGVSALPPVVLLHGWGGTFASTYAAHGWLDALCERGRTCVACDLPGHGPEASHDPLAYGDLAASLLAALPPGRHDVIAFSLGAKLALAIATADPARFRRVVLGGLGDNAFAPEPDGEAVAALLTGSSIGDPVPMAKALAAYALGNGNDGAAMAAVLRRSLNPRINATRLTDGRNMLLVNGDRDAIAVPDELLRAVMPLCGYVRVAGVDHLSLPANPDFRRVALDFIGGP